MNQHDSADLTTLVWFTHQIYLTFSTDLPYVIYSSTVTPCHVPQTVTSDASLTLTCYIIFSSQNVMFQVRCDAGIEEKKIALPKVWRLSRNLLQIWRFRHIITSILWVLLGITWVWKPGQVLCSRCCVPRFRLGTTLRVGYMAGCQWNPVTVTRYSSNPSLRKQNCYDCLIVAFITWNSNLVPLLEGLCTSNPCRFQFSGFWVFAGIEPTTSGLTVPRFDQLS